ncbi:GNAT family N-acetyltransferase [Myroides marinus]|uniref:GNAT family N-acetyltransferase n=1 Tax=Myroides marinus TaxID=703342 RepID=UPI002576C7E0|nr:GNAT family protein [Myroides marinus]MDM1503303.1 GNAT family N-acetyltransferase [Myroides marinus]
MQDVVLMDDKIILKPLEAYNYEDLVDYAISQPDIWKYATVGLEGADGMKAYIETALADRAIGKSYPFIVFDKQTEKYVGSTRFYNIDQKNKTLWLGYTWYAKETQGTGVNKHAKYLLFQYAFEVMGMERIEFRVDNTNGRSKAAVKSIGCTLEGVLRSEIIINTGRRRDTAVFSILKDEWFSHAKEALERKL